MTDPYDNGTPKYSTAQEIEPKEDAPTMTVAEYAANLYERRELP